MSSLNGSPLSSWLDSQGVTNISNSSIPNSLYQPVPISPFMQQALSFGYTPRKSPFDQLPNYAQNFADSQQANLNQVQTWVGSVLSQSDNPVTAARGNNLLGQSIGLNKPIGSDVKSSFISKFNNSFLGQNSSLISSGLNMFNDILLGATGGKRQYEGEKGDITQGIDAATNTIQDFASKIPVIGGIANVGMSGMRLVGNISNVITGGTDGMSKQDAILGSDLANMTGIGLVANTINSAFGKNANTITKDTVAAEQVGSSYGGTLNNIDEALKKSGKKYGAFSTKDRRAANRQIAEAKRQQELMADIGDIASDRFAIQQSTSAINGNRFTFNMRGGYDPSAIRVGKNGLRAKDIVNKYNKKKLDKDQLEGRKPVAKIGNRCIYRNGDDTYSVKQCQDGNKFYTESLAYTQHKKYQQGGNITSNTRSLEELINYAKEQNPRFIQRLSEEPKGIQFTDDNGNQAYGSHYLESRGEYVIPRIQEINGQLQFLDPQKAFDRAIETNNYLKMTPNEAILFAKEYKSGWPDFFNNEIFKHKQGGSLNMRESTIKPISLDNIEQFKQGGQINVIPEGALHARKNNMDMEGITKKGIPVVDKKGEQQAEIERSEIILNLDLTEKLEELEKKYYSDEYSNREKEQFALEAGYLLVDELLNNTIDNTGELLNANR